MSYARSAHSQGAAEAKAGARSASSSAATVSATGHARRRSKRESHAPDVLVYAAPAARTGPRVTRTPPSLRSATRRYEFAKRNADLAAEAAADAKAMAAGKIPMKRGRGRPRKNPLTPRQLAKIASDKAKELAEEAEQARLLMEEQEQLCAEREQARQRKLAEGGPPSPIPQAVVKRGPGRPRKHATTASTPASARGKRAQPEVRRSTRKRKATEATSPTRSRAPRAREPDLYDEQVTLTPSVPRIRGIRSTHRYVHSRRYDEDSTAWSSSSSDTSASSSSSEGGSSDDEHNDDADAAAQPETEQEEQPDQAERDSVASDEHSDSESGTADPTEQDADEDDETGASSGEESASTADALPAARPSSGTKRHRNKPVKDGKFACECGKRWLKVESRNAHQASCHVHRFRKHSHATSESTAERAASVSSTRSRTLIRSPYEDLRDAIPPLVVGAPLAGEPGSVDWFAGWSNSERDRYLSLHSTDTLECCCGRVFEKKTSRAAHQATCKFHLAHAFLQDGLEARLAAKFTKSGRVSAVGEGNVSSSQFGGWEGGATAGASSFTALDGDELSPTGRARRHSAVVATLVNANTLQQRQSAASWSSRAHLATGASSGPPRSLRTRESTHSSGSSAAYSADAAAASSSSSASSSSAASSTSSSTLSTNSSLSAGKKRSVSHHRRHDGSSSSSSGGSGSEMSATQNSSDSDSRKRKRENSSPFRSRRAISIGKQQTSLAWLVRRAAVEKRARCRPTPQTV
eukprot:CAMPEP_0177666310 /NCGR_PEP_ID=MMETSP0447-20121125/21513_1 /TAXON_ID=0 /ORGANISM="Stygamoeba regulata, Strain BSH-02190019" /LENGTH=750 /DNA_ID=CAMNT_0019172449 /DNA_START=249 /DNA_END=2501 /DNA_ORIENTATION=-